MLYAANVYYIVSILNAIQGTIKFYTANQHDLNMEHLFSLRIIEGQLLHLFIDKSNILRPKSIRLLDALSKNASIIANKEIPILFEKNSSHFSKFRILLDRPWSLQNDLKYLPSLNESRVARNFAYKRLKIFHKFVGQLFGAGDDCDPSIVCLNNVFRAPSHTTHSYIMQIFFASVMEQLHCSTKLNKYFKERTSLRDGVASLYADRCSILLRVLEEIVADRSLSDNVIFVFIDIAFVCGQAGFLNFVKRTYLDFLLNLQDSNGCFKGTNTVSCDDNLTTLAVGVLCFYLRVLTDEQMIRSSVVGEFYHSINIDRKIINLAINFFYINTKDVGGILDFNDYAMSIVPEAYNVNGHNNSSRSLSDQSGTFWYYGVWKNIVSRSASCFFLVAFIFFIVFLPKRNLKSLRIRVF